MECLIEERILLRDSLSVCHLPDSVCSEGGSSPASSMPAIMKPSSHTIKHDVATTMSGAAIRKLFPRGRLLQWVLIWLHWFATSCGWVLNSGHLCHDVLFSHPLHSSTVDEGNHEELAVEESENQIRYRGRVAYDGSMYRGFQIQEGSRARTIQASLEDVLQRRFNRSSIRVVGAGRTDSGVSARGQAFHFDMSLAEHEKSLELKQNKTQPPLDHVMNRMLSDEVRVWNVGPAPPPIDKSFSSTEQQGSTISRVLPWNAIHDTTHKLYSYRICLSVMDPIYRYQRWQVQGDSDPVDVALLNKTLAYFEGTHDFRAFAGAVEQAEKKANRKVNSIRTIFGCKLVDESEDYGREGYYRIDIQLSGALYKMVRNMVGTAIDVSRGRVSEDTFLRLLHGGGGDQGQLNRKDNRSKPAPPEGLTLEWVYYDDDGAF